MARLRKATAASDKGNQVSDIATTLEDKNKEELIEEIYLLQKRIAVLEMQDVERKRVEDALVESERRLRDITFSMGDWVWEVDEKGVYTYTSAKGTELFGSVIGKTPFDFMPPDEAKRVAAIFSEIAANKAPIQDLENWNIGKDGENICLLTNGVPILDKEGNLKGYRGVDKDITDHKRADDALLASEERFRALAESALVGIYILQDGKYAYVNPAMARVFGYSVVEMTGMSPREIVQPCDHGMVNENIQRRITGEVQTIQYEVRGRHRDSSTRDVEVYGTRMEVDGGSALVGTLIDITDRKRAEAALEESQAQITAVMNSTNDFIWSVDPERFGLLSWNRAFRDYFLEQRGIELEVGMTPAELVPPDYVPLWHRLFSRALREEFVIVEYVVVAQTRTLLLSLHAMRLDHGAFGISVFGRDITEIKQAEEELLAEKNKLQAILSAINSGITIRNPDYDLIYQNDYSLNTFGNHIGDKCYRAFAGIDRVCDDCPVEKAFSDGKSHSYVKEVEILPGEITFWENTAVPMKDSNESIYACLEINNNITERKQMRDQLRAAADEWHKTFNTIQDMIMIMDREFRLVQVNDAAVKFFGLPKENIIGNPCFTLMHGTESPIDGCPYKKMMDTKDHEETEIYDELRGKWFHVVVDPLLGATGDIIGVVHTVKDITKHKLAEIARTESMERYRAMVEAYDGFIYICSQDYRIEFMNQRLIERTGRNAVGELCYEVLHDRDSVCPWCVNEQVLRGETVRWEVQSPKDHCWYYVVNTPIRHADGTISKQSMIMDITARKQVEETMKENEAALSNSKKDLQRLAGRLISAQEKELCRLSRELHDDLTQRLAVLAIDAGKLELDLGKQPEACPEISQTISQMKEQLIKVSEDVHHLSRQLHPTILDDLGLVRAIESECAALMRRENIEIIFNKEDVPVEMSNDIALCLYRVLQESLKNIITHSRATSCEIFLKGADNTLCLTISDNGVGFEPAEVRNKAGLGLSSMRERAQLIQGDFSIKSRPGQGTVIRIVVPLKAGGA